VLGVVTNLDREHMDCYRDMDDIEAAFVEFMDRMPFYGATTACIDNDALRLVLARVKRKVYTYGERQDADFRVRLLPKIAVIHSSFSVSFGTAEIGVFHLHVPGRHNVLNATAAIAVGIQLGLAPKQIALGLDSFRGVNRRFEIKGVVRGVTVIDDYGHHPTEIRATLHAARDCGYGRIHVLFQPHRYTRTRDLFGEFSRAFVDADSVQVLEIYAASEEPIRGVTGAALAEMIRAEGGRRVEHARSPDEAVARLVAEAREGDAILTLGAGSVSQVGTNLLAALHTIG